MAEDASTIEGVDYLISRRRQKIEAMEAEDDDQALAIYDLGNLLSKRFKMTRDPSDLARAILCYRKARSMMTEGNPKRVQILNNLGVCLETSYIRMSRVEDLDESIQILRQSMELNTDFIVDRVPLQSNLAHRLRILYECKGNEQDLNDAIQVGEDIFQSTPKSHPHWITVCGNLTTQLRMRYVRNEVYIDLERSISLGEDIKASINEGHLKWGSVLFSLSHSLHLQYKRSGSLEHLDKAIDYGKQALQAPVSHQPERSSILNLLGILYGLRYTDFSQLTSDLNHSIELEREALDLLNHESPNRPGYLSNLGNRLHFRYVAQGNLQDLEEAVRHCQDGVTATPLDNLNYISRLNNLGMMLFAQYAATQRLQDLNHAIRRGRAAVTLMEGNNPERQHITANLVVQLGTKFSRIREREDLEEAIRYSRDLSHISVNVSERNGRVANLAVLLTQRYENYREIADLDEAIVLLEKVIVASHGGNLQRGGWLSSQAHCYELLFLKFDKLHHLERGIEIALKAIETTPSDDVRLAERSIPLGKLLCMRSKRTGNIEDDRQALRRYTDAWETVSAVPMVRLQAAQKASALLVQRRCWSEVASMLYSAINLSTKILHGAITREDREYVLNELSGIVPLAASTALKAGQQASEVAQIIEIGRCVITGLEINARMDLSKLKVELPLLHEQFVECRERISSRPKLSSEDRYAADVASHQGLYEKLASIESQIREYSGFERFQLPPTSTEMMNLASARPIVILNASDVSSEAIIVTSFHIRALSLEKLFLHDLHSNVASIATAGSRSWRTPVLLDEAGDENTNQDKGLGEVLAWLWDVAVNPVLKSFGESRPRRILWMSSGVVGIMPIHAAGYHSPESKDNTITQVVSSYTSTFKALKYTLERPTLDTSKNQIALINVPHTPGKDSLIVKHEFDAIMSAFPGKVIPLTHPRKSQVLEILPDCRFAHFACHASSNIESPSDGGLWLASDAGIEILRISELDELTLNHAEIAYLSACSTSEVSPDRLLEEAINLSKSFQMVGYRHVIGSMWGVADSAAGEVAKLFYEQLRICMVKDPSRSLLVAEIFHEAINKFRKGRELKVGEWGPFTHYGP